jgi:hypothetical protein
MVVGRERTKGRAGILSGTAFKRAVIPGRSRRCGRDINRPDSLPDRIQLHLQIFRLTFEQALFHFGLPAAV